MTTQETGTGPEKDKETWIDAAAGALLEVGDMPHPVQDSSLIWISPGGSGR